MCNLIKVINIFCYHPNKMLWLPSTLKRGNLVSRYLNALINNYSMNLQNNSAWRHILSPLTQSGSGQESNILYLAQDDILLSIDSEGSTLNAWNPEKGSLRWTTTLQTTSEKLNSRLLLLEIC